MMRLRLKTKITILITLLVLAVVGVNSWLYVAKLTSQVIQQVEASAVQVQTQIYTQVNNALRDAEQDGRGPASASLDDLREYFRNALDKSAALSSLIDAGVSSPSIYEISIVDSDGIALISSDPSLPGRKVLARPPLKDLVGASFVAQLRVIYGTPQAYEIAYPLGLGTPGQQVPFGEIRIAGQVGLLREQITPALRSAGLLALASVLLSTLLAVLVSNLSLTPLNRISAQLDRISRGEFDQQPIPHGDEFGQVSSKISRIGQQLRGVREIFGTLDQALHGLEAGLLLFTQAGRAVMASPAVESFLGLRASDIIGRPANEIFPPSHPLRKVLQLSGDEFAPVASSEAEIVVAPPGGPSRRVGVSVQVISEGSTRMGALVILRDPESRERIGRQVQMADVTKGVAHEVKNPLNSMRLWLENLKESLPPGEGTPRQAVAVLDSEIKRLDSVVKRFLDFMRPAELIRQETHLNHLLDEVAAIAGPQMARAGVQLEIDCPPIPAIYVDHGLLKQALLNLVYNAIEAMPNGGHLTLAASRQSDHVEISVTDTGVGIQPEHRARVFQLFFTTRPGGSGIGLASAYKIVQLHEGTIEFTSQAGRGTTFRIELPLGPGADESAPSLPGASGGVTVAKA
jgi:PAS domain S-box-containing protein